MILIQISLTIQNAVYNEETRLENNFPKILEFIKLNEHIKFEVIIGLNGCTDRTNVVALEFAKTSNKILIHSTPTKGRGHVLKEIWLNYDSDVHIYMDVDISTNLKYVNNLIQKIIIEGCDIASGNRNHQKSTILRGIKRTLLSKSLAAIIN